MANQIQGLETEYKPWGGLAGIMTGVREADTEAANLQTLQESQLGNAIKGVEAGRAVSDYNDPRMEALRQGGIMGKNQVDIAQGATAAGTQQSDMNAKIAENLAKVPKAHVEKALAETHQQTMGLMGLASALQQGGGSDLNFVTKAMEMAPQLGMNPQDLQQLLTNPELLKKKLAQNQQILTMVPTVLQKMEEQRQKGVIDEGIHAGDRKSREKVSAADNATRTSVEQMGIDAGKYKRGGSGVSITTIYAKMTPEARLGAVQKVLTTGVDPETNDPLTEMARAGYESMYNQDKRTVDASNAARTTGKIDTPAVAGMPTATPPSVGAGSTSLPPGVTIKGQK
jgi:hypothetical protein